MTTLLIVAHTPLASALRAVAEHSYPECAGELLTLDVGSDASPEQVEAQVRALIAGSGHDTALVFVDVFGATPCKGVERLLGDPRIRAVAGVNVPMLWRTWCYGTSDPLDTLVERALAGATRGVVPLGAQNPPPPTCGDAQADGHDQQ